MPVGLGVGDSRACGYLVRMYKAIWNKILNGNKLTKRQAYGIMTDHKMSYQDSCHIVVTCLVFLFALAAYAKQPLFRLNSTTCGSDNFIATGAWPILSQVSKASVVVFLSGRKWKGVLTAGAWFWVQPGFCQVVLPSKGWPPFYKWYILKHAA